MGYACLNAQGVPKNLTAAFEWYQKAALQGDPAGLYSVGVFYEDGIGVPADAGEARRFYELAAAKGHASAKEKLAALQTPVAKAVPGYPGYVYSPHAPNKPAVDVRTFQPGTHVTCPHTGKVFVVP